MKTTTINTFKFEELSTEIQAKLIKKEQDSEYCVFMGGFDNHCIQQIEESGFYANNKIELSYSFSCSQGDGLSFYATGFDKIRDVIAQLLPINKSKTVEVIYNACNFYMNNKNKRYSFASKSDIDFTLDVLEYDKYPNVQNTITQVRQDIENIYIDLCKKLEKQGYSEIEYQRSDNYINDELINQDYDYLENGNIINL